MDATTRSAPPTGCDPTRSSSRATLWAQRAVPSRASGQDEQVPRLRDLQARNRRSVLAAPDTFKGTCSSIDMAEAIERGAHEAGWDCDRCPLSDGGDGFAVVIAASSRPGTGTWETTRVTGPLGEDVHARWWWVPPDAYVESAAASGLVIAGGSRGNDAIRAGTRGTGELIVAALRAGARRVVVGVGGSASTDGGLPAVEAIESAGGLGDTELLVACDVDVPFLEAAQRFGPQKGASSDQVSELRRRLTEVAERYRSEYRVDVTSIPLAGAAGGLAGGLAAIGGRLLGGFDLVAEAVGLERRASGADLIVTGEGRLDATSWSGKVVSGVLRTARKSRPPAPVLVVAGSIGPGGWPAPGAPGAQGTTQVVSLADRFGTDRARAHPSDCVEEAVSGFLRDVAARALRHNASPARDSYRSGDSY